MGLGDCHDPHGKEDMCVAGAIQNFTSQLKHYREGSADRRCKYLNPIYVTTCVVFVLRMFGFSIEILSSFFILLDVPIQREIDTTFSEKTIY